MIALNFAFENECSEFWNVTTATVEKRKQKREGNWDIFRIIKQFVEIDKSKYVINYHELTCAALKEQNAV